MARRITRRTTRKKNPMRSTGMLVVNPRRRKRTVKRNTRKAATRRTTAASRRRNGTKKGMVRKTSRLAYSKRRNGTKKGMVRKTSRRAYSKRRNASTRRRRSNGRSYLRRNRRKVYARRRNGTKKGMVRKTSRRAYAKRRNTRRRNPSLKQSISKLPLIGKPLAMMYGFAPAALLGAISVEPTMMVARLLGNMVGDKLPASLFYSIIGLGMATIVQYLPIKDKSFRDKLSVAVASAAGGVAFYKWRTGMDTSAATEVGLLQLHGAGTGFGALELFPGPLNGAGMHGSHHHGHDMGALELFPGPLNGYGYGDGMAHTVNPYPGAISNGSF
jgi:hypothetical protein